MRVVPTWLRRKDRDPARAMTMVEHLDELRRRVFISIIAIVLAAIAGWFLFQPVLRFILHPYTQACQALPKIQRPPTRCDQLVNAGVIGPFLIHLKIALYVGLGIALPIVLFALGGFFAFYTLPRGLRFLLGFGGQNIVVLPEASKYISFVLLLTLAFGLSFEFPLVLIFLAWVGIVSSQRLRHWRRFAILFIVIFAAVITPSQDPFTLLAMSIPMIVFYEATIWITRLMKR